MANMTPRNEEDENPDWGSLLGGITKDVALGTADFAWSMVKPPNLREENDPDVARYAGSGKGPTDYLMYGVDRANDITQYLPAARKKVAEGLAKGTSNDKVGRLASNFVKGFVDPSLYKIDTSTKMGMAKNLIAGVGTNLAIDFGAQAIEHGLTSNSRPNEDGTTDYQRAGEMGDYELQKRILENWNAGKNLGTMARTIAGGATTGSIAGSTGMAVGTAAALPVVAAQGLFPEMHHNPADPKLLDKVFRARSDARVKFIESALGDGGEHDFDEAVQMMHDEIPLLASRGKGEMGALIPFFKALRQKSDSGDQKAKEALGRLAERFGSLDDLKKGHQKLKEKYPDRNELEPSIPFYF